MKAVFELTGMAAPPMVNGELTFDAPWQGRVFGIARGLAEHGVFEWDAFRARLIERIAAFDRTLGDAFWRFGAIHPGFSLLRSFPARARSAAG